MNKNFSFLFVVKKEPPSSQTLIGWYLIKKTMSAPQRSRWSLELCADQDAEMRTWAQLCRLTSWNGDSWWSSRPQQQITVLSNLHMYRTSFSSSGRVGGWVGGCWCFEAVAGYCVKGDGMITYCVCVASAPSLFGIRHAQLEGSFTPWGAKPRLATTTTTALCDALTLSDCVVIINTVKCQL